VIRRRAILSCAIGSFFELFDFICHLRLLRRCHNSGLLSIRLDVWHLRGIWRCIPYAPGRRYRYRRIR
jgi:hypothetical protein